MKKGLKIINGFLSTVITLTLLPALSLADTIVLIDGQSVEADKVKEYVRENEDLKMGGALLDSIVYSFWRQQLYAPTIWTRRQSNYRALRNEAFNRFGVGLKRDQNRECYFWSDLYRDRIMKYEDADQSGLFWMRSKELDRCYQISQIKTPSTDLKAGKQKP